MEVITWAFNAVDKIISTRHTGRGEPSCPGGTYTAGYVMDSWKSWQVLCLSVLSVEDVEDVYLLGVLIVAILLLGAGQALVFWKIARLRRVIQDEMEMTLDRVIQREMKESLGNMAAAIQNQMNRKMETIQEKLTAQLKENDGWRQEVVNVMMGKMTRVIQDQIKWNMDGVLAKLALQITEAERGRQALEE